MTRSLVLVPALCSALISAGQTMNLHLQDGSTVLYEQAAIDSITFLGGGSSMVIHLEPLQEEVYSVFLIDSITYSPGGPIGSPSLATLTPTGTYAGALVPVYIGDEGASPLTSTGVCWGLDPLPTVADNSVLSGTTLGRSNLPIAGLAQNTVYYARAFAVNAQGTAYGNQVMFSTSGISGTGLNPALTYGSVSDAEGHSYATIAIGSQVWMAEDLRATRYANGDPIALVEDNAMWSAQSAGAWCYLQNDPAQSYMDGKLYNYYAISDPRNVCPLGWHVPTEAEWEAMASTLGAPLQSIGAKMKSVGSWPQSVGVTNSSGFSGVPGGKRATTGSFFNFPVQVLYWSSTFSGGASVTRELRDDITDLWDGQSVQRQGLSVRCIQD
jgi:uncharacterized protein (TIGR02145 family)